MNMKIKRDLTKTEVIVTIPPIIINTEPLIEPIRILSRINFINVIIL